MPERLKFAEAAIQFFRELEYTGSLPEGISVMNPFRDDPGVIPLITRFYQGFYNDYNTRFMILGINPGRFGAGVTGIPFTDSKRLFDAGLSKPDLKTHETSSVFIYEMIDAFGGVGKFYNKFFISAVSPLGFTKINNKGRQINYNYYDSRELTDAVSEFIVRCLKRQLKFGIERELCFCLGTGKNYEFLDNLNNKLNLFKRIVPLEHPRFIMQYRSQQKDIYIGKYLREFNKVLS